MENDQNAKNKASVIARHYQAAGESIAAFDWFLEAAKSAWTLGAKENTINAYNQAERLLENAPEGTFGKEKFLQLYKEWCEFAYQANLADMLDVIGVKLQNYGEQHHDSHIIAFGQMALANACFIRIEMDTGLDLITKASAHLEHSGDLKALILVTTRKGAFCWWNNQFDQAIQAANRIRKLCSTIEKTSPEKNSNLFFARHLTGMSLYAKGQANAAKKYAQKTFDRYFHKIKAFDRMRMLQMMAYANLISADYAQCETYIHQGLKITHELNNSFVHEDFLTILAKIELFQGRIDEAYHHANELLRLSENSHRTHVMVSAYSLLAEIYAILQNYSSALQYCRLAQIRGRSTIQSIPVIENQIHLASLLGLMGQHDEAKQILRSSLEITRQAGTLQLYSRAIILTAFTELFSHNLKQAEQHFQEAAQITGQNGLRYESTWSNLGLSRIALLRGQFDQSLKFCKQMIDNSIILNTASQQLQALQLCADIYRATHKPSPLAYREQYLKLIQKFEAHVQSEPLKKDFKNAKNLWLKSQQR